MAAAASPRTSSIQRILFVPCKLLHEIKGKGILFDVKSIEYLVADEKSSTIIVGSSRLNSTVRFHRSEFTGVRHWGMKFITTVRLFVKNDREPQSRRKRITKIRQGSRRDRLYSSDRFVLHDSLFTHDHRFSHSSFSSSFARSSFIPPTICLRAVRNRRWITLTNVPWNFIVKKGKKKKSTFLRSLALITDPPSLLRLD